MDPFEPVVEQRKRRERRRAYRERMDSRANIMKESRERQFGRPRAPADCSLGFEDGRAKPRAGENDSRR
jgi:hypothetical protein